MFILLAAVGAWGGEAGPVDVERPGMEDLTLAVGRRLAELQRAPLTQAEADALDPVAYSERMFDERFEGINDLARQTLRMLNDPTDADQRTFEEAFAGMRDLAAKAAAGADVAPTYHGDATLRDALANAFHSLATVLEQNRKEGVPAMFAVPATNDTLARLEALELHQQALEAASSTALREAQRRYADAHQLRLIETPPVEWVVPDFTAPGIPAEGSALSGNSWVTLSANHLAGAVAIHNRAMQAFSTYVSAAAPDGGPGVEAARSEAVRAIAAVQAEAAALGDWHGDRSLLEALTAELEWMAGFLGADGATMARLAAAGLHDNAEVDAYNVAVRALNDGFGSRSAAFVRTADAFKLRWRLAEYNATRDARLAETRRQLERFLLGAPPVAPPSPGSPGTEAGSGSPG